MKNYILFITILCSFSFNGHAQKAKLAAADKKYDNYAYIDAIKTYERVAQKGYKSVDMFQKLGNAYYFNSDYQNAAKWYAELFAMNTELTPEYYYRYSHSLKSIGDFKKSDEMLALFNQKSGNDSLGKLSKSDYLAEIKANSGRYDVEDAGINSKYSDSFIFSFYYFLFIILLLHAFYNW